MQKTILATSFLAATTFAWLQQQHRPIVPLEQGTLTIESVAGGEAVVRVEAENEEQLEHVNVLDPHGRLFLQLDASDGTQRGLSGLVMELRETDLAHIQAGYTPGQYEFRATTVGGNVAVGSAQLSFDLPAAPRIVYPQPGALVPARGLTILWLADRNVSGYRLQLEQDENDGLVVNLPPGRSSFRVPDGLLPRGVETRLELSAIGANGNRTLVEVPFTPML